MEGCKTTYYLNGEPFVNLTKLKQKMRDAYLLEIYITVVYTPKNKLDSIFERKQLIKVRPNKIKVRYEKTNFYR